MKFPEIPDLLGPELRRGLASLAQAISGFTQALTTKRWTRVVEVPDGASDDEKWHLIEEARDGLIRDIERSGGAPRKDSLEIQDSSHD